MAEAVGDNLVAEEEAAAAGVPIGRPDPSRTQLIRAGQFHAHVRAAVRRRIRDLQEEIGRYEEWLRRNRRRGLLSGDSEDLVNADGSIGISRANERKVMREIREVTR